MADDTDERDAELGREADAVAARAATDPDDFLAMVPHFYRGEISQVTNAHDRIDRTTDWAVALIAALLSLVFASPAMPAYLLLIGLFILCTFLLFEVRRYRFYDMWRSRVRFVQENVFAALFDPAGVEHADWRERLGEDLRTPTFKVSTFEALSRRVRRVYWLLFSVLGVAWVAKVTLFTPELRWTAAAELPGVSGLAVAATLGAFYAAVVAVAVWPTERAAKGEVYGTRPGDWKREDEP